MSDGKLNYDGTVYKIPELVSMGPKVIVISGETDEDVKRKLGDKILGHT